jgi:hypothetical protein
MTALRKPPDGYVPSTGSINPRPGITIRRLRALRCRECDVRQGDLHERGCWRERCARCGEQAVFCGHNDNPVAELRRVPFIDWTNVCGSCGQLDPDFFDVPDTVWRHYIEPEKRCCVVCITCWQRIVDLIDGGRYQDRYGGPVALGSEAFRARHPRLLPSDGQ